MIRKYSTLDIGKIFEEWKSHAIGFDQMFDNMAAGSSPAPYPPYNIVKIDEDSFSIQIAAAGFREDEFNVNVVPEGNQLIVQGVQERGEEKVREYYHKGIAARNFTRHFTLAEGVEVNSAIFENGMLNILLTRFVPEKNKPINILVNEKPGKYATPPSQKELLQES